jgi:hypothetical protein
MAAACPIQIDDVRLTLDTAPEKSPRTGNHCPWLPKRPAIGLHQSRISSAKASWEGTRIVCGEAGRPWLLRPHSKAFGTVIEIPDVEMAQRWERVERVATDSAFLSVGLSVDAKLPVNYSRNRGRFGQSNGGGMSHAD